MDRRSFLSLIAAAPIAALAPLPKLLPLPVSLVSNSLGDQTLFITSGDAGYVFRVTDETVEYFDRLESPFPFASGEQWTDAERADRLSLDLADPAHVDLSRLLRLDDDLQAR